MGFLYVKNHGVDPKVTSEALELARAFFALPQVRKGGWVGGWVGRGDRQGHSTLSLTHPPTHPLGHLLQETKEEISILQAMKKKRPRPNTLSCRGYQRVRRQPPTHPIPNSQ